MVKPKLIRHIPAPVLIMDSEKGVRDRALAHCPNCMAAINGQGRMLRCPNCAQHLDWKNYIRL